MYLDAANMLACVAYTGGKAALQPPAKLGLPATLMGSASAALPPLRYVRDIGAEGSDLGQAGIDQPVEFGTAAQTTS
jgi:hypothetical protein